MKAFTFSLYIYAAVSPWSDSQNSTKKSNAPRCTLYTFICALRYLNVTWHSRELRASTETKQAV